MVEALPEPGLFFSNLVLCAIMRRLSSRCSVSV
jgi:hypothetical protein